MDFIARGFVHGWALDEVTLEPVPVTISLDGHAVADIVGTEFRADLQAAGLGDGSCGFAFALPAESSVAVVRATFAQTGELLENGERFIASDGIPKSDLFAGVLARGLWMPRSIGVDGRIAITGWAIPPAGMPAPFGISHDDRPLELLSITPSAEAEAGYGVPAGSGAYEFLAVGALDPAATPTTKHRFTFVDPRTGEPFNPHHSIVFQSASDRPVPDAARRRRVGGASDLGPYLLQGSTSYARLDQVLTEYFGTAHASPRAILDWGCGCGRVFSHLPTSLHDRLTGIDIDDDNIAWCRAAYPAARFLAVPLEPPTELAAGSFDVVFGISVLTHLLEPAADAWLAELHRLTMPGAAVLVTVLGETAWGQADLPLTDYARYRASGFYVSGKNPDLDLAGTDASQYFNTFVSRRYIYERWSRFFDILDVVAGGIVNHQDLVVMRRRL